MATKEKWVELFEKVIGRKPSPKEFMAAKEVDFDLKAIKRIAGVELPQNTEQAREVTQVASLAAEYVASPQAPQAEVGQAPTNDFLASPSQVTEAKVKKVRSKKKILAFSLASLFLVALAGFFFYFSSITGTQVTVEQFEEAVKTSNYDEIASMLSTKDNKWTKADAKNFVKFLDSKVDNLNTELTNVVKSDAKKAVTDDKGNKLLGLEKSSKKFGIFQEYRVVTYPLQVSIQTNLDNATASPQDQSPINLKKDSLTKIGDFYFNAESITVKGKTGLGQIESAIHLDWNKAQDNDLKLDLKAGKRKLTAGLPSEVANPTSLKLLVNGKEVATGLTADIEVLPYQELEVYASFSIDNATYTTDKQKITVGDKALEVKLSIPSDVQKKLKDSELAKKAAEEKKVAITSFLSDYRSAVFSSVSSRSNYFSKYYDTSSDVYKEMVEWTTGGGVAKAKIDYYSAGSLEIKSITEENGNYIVKTYEDFTVHYRDSTPNSVSRKDKTYYLKPAGDSFFIYNIEVTDH